METKRIYRSHSDRLVAGVAGGLAAFFNIDPLFVRIGFVILALLNGMGAVLYLALWVLIPNEGSTGDARSAAQESVNEMQAKISTVVERIRGTIQR